MVADVYKTSPVFIALVVCSQIGGVLKKSKRERERRRKVSTRPLIPLWDAIIVRERMQWETTAPRRTTGSEGALIKLKNIVTALYPHACSSTQRIQKREKRTEKRAEKTWPPTCIRKRNEKENHLWERASIWERERERWMERTQTWVEIVAISVMEINEIIGIVAGVEGKKMIARKTVDPLWILLSETEDYCSAGWRVFSFPWEELMAGAIRGRLILIRYRRMETNR